MKTPLLCDPVARLGRFKQSNVVNVDRIMLSNKVRQANPCSEIVKSAWCSNLSRMLKLVFEQGWASLGPLRRQTQEPVHTPLPKVLHLSKRCVGGAIWSISGDRQCASALAWSAKCASARSAPVHLTGKCASASVHFLHRPGQVRQCEPVRAPASAPVRASACRRQCASALLPSLVRQCTHQCRLGQPMK